MYGLLQVCIYVDMCLLGRDVRKPVFGVSDWAGMPQKIDRDLKEARALSPFLPLSEAKT